MNVLFFLKPKAEIAYLYEDYSLRQTLEKMEYYRYSAIPVINRQGNYAGTITEGDLLWHMKREGRLDLHDTEDIELKQIEKLRYNEPVNVNCEIEDLVLTAMNQNFVPVIDDNKIFIGIITRKDIIQYCYEKLKEHDEV